jgi:hypothetical protein
VSLFDFIQHDDLRSGLESDYRELRSCAEAKAWKAVIILSGSIIEAVLTDTLVSAQAAVAGGSDPLRMDLAGLISACHAQGFITQRSVDLCSAIRSYRNLIHPGRSVRLGDKVDESGAKIAAALIRVIADEVATRRRQTYGLTGPQLLSKIEKDSSAEAILTQLVAELNPIETERLLLRHLPSRYLELNYADDPDGTMSFDRYSLLDIFRRCYRLAVEGATHDIQKKVAAEYIRLLREGSEREVVAYDEGFFTCVDCALLEPRHVALVKEHALGRLRSERIDRDLTTYLVGLEAHLLPADVQRWLDPLMLRLGEVSDKEAYWTGDLRKYIEQSILALPPTVRPMAVRRIKDWVKRYREKPGASVIPLVEGIDVMVSDDLPP